MTMLFQKYSDIWFDVGQRSKLCPGNELLLPLVPFAVHDELVRFGVICGSLIHPILRHLSVDRKFAAENLTLGLPLLELTEGALYTG